MSKEKNCNLLQETLDKLKHYNKTPEDVRWVGNDRVYTTWENFKKIAGVEYYNGFGSAHVATDLKIVGEDWWLTRGKYDGKEWWVFETLQTRPPIKAELKSVVGELWPDLEELNPHIVEL